MTAVRDLDFAHRFTLNGAGPYLEHIEVEATEPLRPDGITSFVRYQDEAATRYGYVTSGWATERDGGLESEVLLYAVEGDADGTPPAGHPSGDRRFRQIAEVYATTSPAPPAPTAPGAATVWVRRRPGETPVPVSLDVDESLGGLTQVWVLGAGVLPADKVLLLARAGLPEDAAHGPVDADVFSYTYRDEDKVAARVRSGRARPIARLTFGTLEQLTKGPAR